MKLTVAAILATLTIYPSLVTAQQKPAPIAPAETLAEGWEEIDQRLIFLMVRLANVETSLDAVNKAIGKNTGRRVARTGEAKRAEAGNDLMDRKGGGPMKWSEFYGTTAEKFFYHPTDRNSTYHTSTVLSQQGPQADNKVGGGVPASQGLPVHQRPPQFDYIYRANENARERAEAEAGELKGKIQSLIERRQRLEVEQAGLWCEVAFRAVSHYDLDKKPLYRFEPLLVDGDSEARQHAEAMKTAAAFMRVALSIIDEAQKDQAATFSKIKPAVSDARLKLSDAFLRLAIDVTDRKTTEGKFAALAKRLDDVASNLSDSYMVANEGDQAKDQQRKDTFRAMLQASLVSYAQIILALDEMSVVMKDDWKYKPDVGKPIQFVSLADVPTASSEIVTTSKPLRSESAVPKPKASSTETPLQGNWKATELWANGRQNTNPDFWRDPKTLSVKGKSFNLVLIDGTFQGTVETDASNEPASVTFKTTGRNGMELRGVYEVDGDVLTVCWVIFDKAAGREPQRPTTLEPAEGVMKFVFQRQTTAKGRPVRGR